VADDVKLRYAYAAGREQEPVQHYFYSLSANMYNFDNTSIDGYYDTFDKYTINGTLNNDLGNQASATLPAAAVAKASKNVMAGDSEFSQMTNLRTGDLLPSTEINFTVQPGVTLPSDAVSGTLIDPDTTVARLLDEYGRDPADPYEDTQYWYSVKMKSIEDPLATPYTGLTRAVSEMYTNDYVSDENQNLINATSVRLIGNADDFAVSDEMTLPTGNQREIEYTTDKKQQTYNASGTMNGNSSYLWTSQETGWMGTVAYTGLSASGQPMDEALPFGNQTLTASNVDTLNVDPIIGSIQKHDRYYFNPGILGGEGAGSGSMAGYIANDFNFVRTGPRLRTVGQQLEMKSTDDTVYERMKPYPGKTAGSRDANPPMEGQTTVATTELPLYNHGDNGIWRMNGTSQIFTGYNLASWEKGWQWATARTEGVKADDDGIDDYIFAGVQGNGEMIRLAGGDHIQDGYHIGNLGSTVSTMAYTSKPSTGSASAAAAAADVTLGNPVATTGYTTDHNTDWLYDKNGDGIAGRNEAYADQQAPPEDTETGKVYDSYRIPTTVPTRAGYQFAGYRLVVIDTGYEQNRDVTYWNTKTTTNTSDTSKDATWSWYDSDKKKNVTVDNPQASPAAYQYGLIPDDPATGSVDESYGAAYVMDKDGVTRLLDTGGGQVLVQPGDEILGVAQSRAVKGTTGSSANPAKWTYKKAVYGTPDGSGGYTGLSYDPGTKAQADAGRVFVGYGEVKQAGGDPDTFVPLDYYPYDGLPYETPAWEIMLTPVWGPTVQYTDRWTGYPSSDGQALTLNLPADQVTDADIDPYETVDDILPIDATGQLTGGYTIPAEVPRRSDGALFQYYIVYVDNMDYHDDTFVLLTDSQGKPAKFQPGQQVSAGMINNQNLAGTGSDTTPGNIRLTAVWRMPIVYTDNENGTNDLGIDVDDPTNTTGAGKDITVPNDRPGYSKPGLSAAPNYGYDDLSDEYYYPYTFLEYADTASQIHPAPKNTTTQNVYGDPLTPDGQPAGYTLHDHTHTFPQYEWDHWFIRSGDAKVILDKDLDGTPDPYLDDARVLIKDVRGWIYVTAVWKYSVRYDERYEDLLENAVTDTYGNLTQSPDGVADVSHFPPDEVDDDDGDGTADGHPPAYSGDYIDDYVRFYTDYVSGGAGAGQGWYDALPEYSAYGPGYMILSNTDFSAGNIANETPQKVGAVFEYFTVTIGGIYGDNASSSNRHLVMADDMESVGVTGDPVDTDVLDYDGAQKFYPGDVVPFELFLKYKGRIILEPHWKTGSVLYDGNEAQFGEVAGSARHIPDHWPENDMDYYVGSVYASHQVIDDDTGINAYHSGVGVTFGIQWHDPKHRGTGAFNDGNGNPDDEPLTPFYQDGDWDEASRYIPELGTPDTDHPYGPYSFLGWNTKKDGSGDWYYPAAEAVSATQSNPAVLPGFTARLPEGYTPPAGKTTYGLHAGSDTTLPEYGITFYAIWDPPMVQYHFQGGVIADNIDTDPTNDVQRNDGQTLLDLAKEKASTPSVGKYVIPSDLYPGTGAKIARAGYLFFGWNTKADGSGAWFTADGSQGGDYSAQITVASGTTMHLYAIWAPAADVYYHANGDGPGDPAETMYAGAYDDIHITGVPCVTETDGGGNPLPGFTGHEEAALGRGYKVRPASGGVPQWPLTTYPDGTQHNGHFKEWNTDPAGLGLSAAPNDTFILRSNTEFFAVWENWIDFKPNGSGASLGAVPARDTVSHGINHYSIPADEPERAGYAFDGWNTKADGTGVWYYPGGLLPAVLRDAVLYAQWTKLPVEDPEDPPDDDDPPEDEDPPDEEEDPPVIPPDDTTVEPPGGGGGGTTEPMEPRLPGVLFPVNAVTPIADTDPVKPHEPGTATSVTVADAPEPENPDDEGLGMPLFGIPVGSPSLRAAWSLLSLILSAIALAFAIGYVWRAAARKARVPRLPDGTEDAIARAVDAGRSFADYEAEREKREEQEERRRRMRRFLRTLATALGATVGIVWLLLDDLTLPMTWINRWTPVVLLWFIVAMVVFILFRLAHGRKDEDEDGAKDEDDDDEEKVRTNAGNKRFRTAVVLTFVLAAIGVLLQIWLTLRIGRHGTDVAGVWLLALLGVPLSFASAFDHDRLTEEDMQDMSDDWDVSADLTEM
jgi:hypothetical protein